uniref:Uncharacterized protein n=1 Tax=Oryza glumipatula TaxID=40148 RepID=A0A0D9YNU0_9ORYZ
MLPEAKELLPLEMEVLPPKLEDMLESRVIILLLEILNLHKDLLLERKNDSIFQAYCVENMLEIAQ